MATEGNEPAYPSVYDKKQLTTTAIVNNGLSKREVFAKDFAAAILSTIRSTVGIKKPMADAIAKEALLLTDSVIEALNTVNK